MTKGLADRKVIGKEENKASKKPREELLQEGEELLTQDIQLSTTLFSLL